MRVNVYAEELTERVEFVTKETADGVFTGVRFYLELPATVNDVNGERVNVSGPFFHREGDDDSAAVTFWGERRLHYLLGRALALMDARYGIHHDSAAAQESAPTAEVP